MTPLRQRMIEDLQLRGLSPKTQDAYVRAVRQLAEHYGKSPDRISEEELRQYFLYLKNVKHASRSACTIALCGIKFFYQHTLRREWPTFDLVRPPREKKLPVVLSTAGARRILECLRHHRSNCLSRKALSLMLSPRQPPDRPLPMLPYGDNTETYLTDDPFLCL